MLLTPTVLFALLALPLSLPFLLPHHHVEGGLDRRAAIGICPCPLPGERGAQAAGQGAPGRLQQRSVAGQRDPGVLRGGCGVPGVRPHSCPGQAQRPHVEGHCCEEDQRPGERR